MSLIVRAEISANGRNIEVTWDGDWEEIAQAVETIKHVPGGIFVSEEKSKIGKPYWRFPLEMEVGRRLQRHFKDRLRVGKFLKSWALERKKNDSVLREISHSQTADLTRLREVLPDLEQAIHIGPKGKYMTPEERAEAYEGTEASYQAADVAFMAVCPHPINANQPGTGKTIETIASVFESGDDQGSHLIVAPVSSLDAVWREELEHWQPHPVELAIGDKRRREEAIEDALAMHYDGFPFWLVVNPDMLTLKSVFDRCHNHEHPKTAMREMRECDGCEEHLVPPFPGLYEFEWDHVILDEFHKIGLTNPETKTSKGITRLKAKKRIALSGTPMGGKVLRLWGALHYLYPDEFGSKYRFAKQWLIVEKGYTGHEKIVDELREGEEDSFWQMVSAKMVRRTKAEVLPWLPPKQYIPLWATMDGKQEAQYKEFAKDAEIRIDEEKLSATSILAEYTRLRQFAFSTQRLESYLDHDEDGNEVTKFKPYPTIDSCKLPHIMEILDERGITPRGENDGGDEKVVIFSQFTTVVDLVYEHLVSQDIAVGRITGNTKERDRATLVKQFQETATPRVLVMNTHAGGVSITLDRASTVVILDETWNPDDQEQAEDRCHRGSRIHQVQVYYIRTKGTIEEYIKTVTDAKAGTNFSILDARRLGLRADHVEDPDE